MTKKFGNNYIFVVMKLTAAILILCVITMSAFGGMLKSAQPKVKDCCVKMACDKAPGKKHSDPCKPDCEMMFSCSLCGFTAVEPLTITAPHSTFFSKPLTLYRTGELSAFHSSSWKPPKAC